MLELPWPSEMDQKRLLAGWLGGLSLCLSVCLSICLLDPQPAHAPLGRDVADRGLLVLGWHE